MHPRPLLSAAALAALFLATATAASDSASGLPHHRRNRLAAQRTLPRTSSLLPASSRARLSRAVSSWSTPSHVLERAANNGRLAVPDPYTIYPAAFGADPTGKTDSSAAFSLAVAALLARNTSGRTDESGTWDLGGATMDLEGGDYLISSPIALPSNYSNFRILHGTIRAAPSFPAAGYLIELGTPGSYCENWGDSCTENVSFEDLFLDGSNVAYGCIEYVAVIGVNAGPDMFCVNFNGNGMHMVGGHEVILHESWLGSCWYTPPSLCWLNATALGNATGVLIDGNDHYVSNTIVFAGLVGMQVNGAANVFDTVHTWNTQTGSVSAAAGIIDTVWQNRYVGIYMDFVPFVCSGCAVTTVTNGFFLGGAQILFRPHPNAYPVRGVYIAANQFVGLGDGQATVVALPPSVPGNPSYSAINDVTIVGALVDNPNAVVTSTVAVQTLRGQAGPWTADFSSLLVFDADAKGSTTGIQTISVSAVSDTGVPLAVFALPANGSRVTVEPLPAYAGVVGTVTITVDQSTRTGP